MDDTAARLADVVGCLEQAYDPRWAEPWDAVGLVCGDPEQPVRRVLFAVDPTHEVAEEAVGVGAELLVTHHPLFLAPVHGVAATTAKGRVVHRLLRAGIALHTCHTNADRAAPGVSDAFATALGLTELRPLDPDPAPALDKLVTFVPLDAAQAVLDALAGAGAGAIGDYERCAWTTRGVGTFRPVGDARPTIGSVGQVEQVEEARVEMVAPRELRAEVVAALLRAHPYEEPAYDVLELAPLPSPRGAGRVGALAEPETLGAFARRTAAVLPATAGGVRVAGDPDRSVREVAVCGGSGDAYLDRVLATGVDAYVTSDLRHHRASEFAQEGGTALLDVSHWAAEWTWLPRAAQRLEDDLVARGTTVETAVSRICTDPWRFRTSHPGEEARP